MGFKRGIIQDGGLFRAMRAGDGSVFNPALQVVATDANDTITVARLAAGMVQYTGFTAGRSLTIDTGANIAAAFPEMDIGDSIHFQVSILPAFAGTWVAAAGVTLAGRATVLAASLGGCLLTKTGAATFTLYGL